MTLTLYMFPVLPPVRAVLMAANVMDIQFEKIIVKTQYKEQLKPEYIKMNPQHTLPTLKDDDFILWDSHAIMGYLINKYGKQHEHLYPSEPHKRATIDQRLHFDTGNLFRHLFDIVHPIYWKGAKEVPQDVIDVTHESFGFLEKFLEGNTWVAGDFLSIADFSIITTLTSIEIVLPVDPEKYPNITAWKKRCESWPCYEINREGVKGLSEFVLGKLKENQAS